ncbi:alpha/beta-hydrolase family protein [Propionimicrobium lymphophilum]|uniref:alpha/beta-hydrolase family protein n=1 Tax=Propionimicrobium lymphophilum TaxID=33012 RepID=UPI00040C4BAC|nr:alpha/beta-hydrolase family protein [Propionimicrobium lymphophilum]
MVSPFRCVLPGSVSLPTLGGVAGYAASFTASLLPRPWYFQGLISGIGALGGFQLGKWASYILNSLAKRAGLATRVSPKMKLTAQIAGGAVAAVGLIGVPLLSIRWQRRAAKKAKVKGPNLSWAFGSSGAAAGAFAILYGQWRATMCAINFISRQFPQRHVWRLLSRLTATAVTLATIMVILDQVIMRAVPSVAKTASAAVDLRAPEELKQPLTRLCSGSPFSLESWDQLGLQGKRFVCGKTTAEKIERVMGEAVDEPIRAYASLNGRSLDEAVDAVLSEVDRMDGWSRANLLLVTTTGRGNVNEWAASAFEYLTRGDCTLIAMQYSGLPSAVTTLTSKSSPVEASKLLFEAVEKRLADIPNPPKVYLNGESLGAYGSCGIFDGYDDLLARADGGLWLGCPEFTPLAKGFIEARDSGSDVVVPVYDGGRHVRFAAKSADLQMSNEWESPRFCFLQNDTDPVVYWNSRLLYEKPSWLAKPRPGSAMADMTWMPFITFWQVAADMTSCRSVGPGYGHKYYAHQVVPAWVGILGLDEHADYRPLYETLNADVPIVSGDLKFASPIDL